MRAPDFRLHVNTLSYSEHWCIEPVFQFIGLRLKIRWRDREGRIRAGEVYRTMSALREEDLALCAGPAPSQVAAGSTTVVPQSGVAFPVTLTPPWSIVPLLWTGTATRERKIFKVNVYAFRLHVDADVAQRELAAFKGKPLEALNIRSINTCWKSAFQ